VGIVPGRATRTTVLILPRTYRRRKTPASKDRCCKLDNPARRMQLPQWQHQGTFAEKAWHADCCVVAAARFGARKFI
jgi:hypothetical protein